MFIGHAALAFAVAALLVLHKTGDRRTAFLVGSIAGVFGMLPDIDVLVGVIAFGQVLVSDPASVWTLTETFWEATNTVHRGATHSLVLAVSIAASAYLFISHKRTASVFLLVVSSLVVYVASSLNNAVIIALFGVCAIGISHIAINRTQLKPELIGFAGVVGLVTHPVGDLFTGEPPEVFYPLFELGLARIAPAVDPTVNLIFAGVFEVAMLWIGLAVFGHLSPYNFKDNLTAYGGTGTVMAFAPFFIQPPTMETSYYFVLPIVGLALLSAVVASIDGGGDSDVSESLFRGGLAGLTALSLAFGSFILVYLARTSFIV